MRPPLTPTSRVMNRSDRGRSKGTGHGKSPAQGRAERRHVRRSACVDAASKNRRASFALPGRARQGYPEAPTLAVRGQRRRGRRCPLGGDIHTLLAVGLLEQNPRTRMYRRVRLPKRARRRRCPR